jgi:ferredoxin-like protein FixX
VVMGTLHWKHSFRPSRQQLYQSRVHCPLDVLVSCSWAAAAIHCYEGNIALTLLISSHDTADQPSLQLQDLCSSAAAGSFECNSCARARGSAEVTADCGATLIVCPTPILEQWREEAAKHLHEGES